MSEVRSLGKYEVRGTLGRGAMGTVYDGWDPRIGRRVAIKTVPLPAEPDADTLEAIERFKREAQAAGKLSHPNIVAVYDQDEVDDLVYIVMEFVDGPSLKSLLDGGERMGIAGVATVMEQLLAGLQFSHSRGVIHRDIKPANIMLTSDRQVKIADFGIARIEQSSLTQVGTVMGTPAYMSPEQFMGQPVDARTDVYSAGVVLYQLLTGERPFEGTGLTAIMHKALHTEPAKPSSLSVTAPPALDDVVLRAIAKRPDARFGSAAEFAEAVRLALAANDSTVIRSPGPSVPPPPLPLPPAPRLPAPAPRSRAPLLAGVAVAGLLVLAGGGWWLFGRSTSQTPETAAPGSSPAQQAGPALTANSTVQSARSPEPSPSPEPPPVPAAAAPPQSPATPEPPASPQSAPSLGQSSAAPPPQAVPEPRQQSAQPPITAPQPLPQPQPVPKPAPEPDQAAPPPDPATLRRDVAAALPQAHCALATAEIPDAGPITLAGISGDPEALRASIASLPTAAGREVLWRGDTVHATLCRPLEILAPLVVRSGAGALTLDLASRAGTALREDELIQPHIVMPEFPAWLRLDYMSSDGTLVHFFPTLAEAVQGGRRIAAQPSRKLSAHEALTLGRPGKDKSGVEQPTWPVGEPFGTDMILAIASSSPLKSSATANYEDAKGAAGYLDRMAAEIETLRAGNAKVVGAVLLVKTTKQ